MSHFAKLLVSLALVSLVHGVSFRNGKRSTQETYEITATGEEPFDMSRFDTGAQMQSMLGKEGKYLGLRMVSI